MLSALVAPITISPEAFWTLLLACDDRGCALWSGDTGAGAAPSARRPGGRPTGRRSPDGTGVAAATPSGVAAATAGIFLHGSCSNKASHRSAWRAASTVGGQSSGSESAMVKTSGSFWVVTWLGDPAQAGGQRREGDEVSANHGGDPACKGTVLCVLVGVLIKAVVTAIARARAAKGLRVVVGPVARNPAEEDLGTD